MDKIVVELCMGSSCFARGNSQALSDLENYIAERGLEDRVEIVGHLCLEDCSRGPNVRIAGINYSGIAPDVVLDLVRKELEKGTN